MKKNILLGSLSVSHEIWLPYASGCLQAYAQRNPVVQRNFNFLSPLYKTSSSNNDLQKLLSDVDILGLTNYVWNQWVNDKIAQQFKEINPEGTVVYGGPNIPKDLNLQRETALQIPFVDHFFVGPGEENFLKFLLDYQNGNLFSPTGTFGIFDGTFYSNTSDYPSQVNGEALPDPYNAGVFDEILAKEEKVKCSFESNRGCPYSCSFCDWGGTANSRITAFSSAAVNKALHFIYQNENITELEILDANFGMFKRDLELVEHMIQLKSKFGFSPKISYSGLAKNGSKYLPTILEKIHFELGAEQRHLKISFQTHDANTLRLANRENIKNEKLLPVITQLKNKGLKVTAEMIIGLPGETAQSWLKTLETNWNLEIDYLRTYFLIVAPNTLLKDAKYQKDNSIKTKKLRFPLKFANYSYKDIFQKTLPLEGNAKGYEEYEVIRSCSSYDLAELSTMFDYWWFYHNFINSHALVGVISFLTQKGIPLSKIILQFFDWLPDNGILHTLINNNRCLIEKIFADDDISEINDLAEYFYFSRCLRLDDVYEIMKNQHLVREELSSFLQHFIPDPFERNQQIDAQLALWSKESGNKPEWRSIKPFFGTDARI